MKSDFMRHAIVSADGARNIPAAGYTGNSDLLTDWIDVSELVGNVTVIGVTTAGHASISGTLSLDHATSAAGANSATVTADGDFAGGADANGVNNTGGRDFAVSNALDGAITYAGDRQFVRGRLRVNNASNATVTVGVSLVAIGQPQVSDPNR